MSQLIPSPYFTSDFETASLLSSDAQTAFLSGSLFSEVLIPTLVPARIRLPEYYTADQSRPPNPNFADYPLRVDGITIYNPILPQVSDIQQANPSAATIQNTSEFSEETVQNTQSLTNN